MSSSGIDIVAGTTQAVENWYNEIKDYNWNTPDFYGDHTGVIGHFTQVIWAASTEYGTGIALSDDGTQLFVVGRHRQAGNFLGKI